MSRANISNIRPTKGGIVVTFALRNGEYRSYAYDLGASQAILSGADPAHFMGEQVQGGVGGMALDAEELAELAAEVAEMI